MRLRFFGRLVRIADWTLTAIGLLALGFILALATPMTPPPELASIHEGAVAISAESKPDLSRFQARDGTWLAYRLYPADNGATDKLAILAHGSTASSDEMNAVARALAASGIVAVAIDARGHGASGTRGDVAYLGQINDDLADLVAELRKSYPEAKLTLIGHSLGGGFVLRVAAAPEGALFEHFVLLAPYLGAQAPTNRPSEGAGRWAEPNLPRIYAILILRALGIDWPQSLPAIAYANPPEAKKSATSQYTFRLLFSYGPPRDWQGAFRKVAGRIDVIDGANDELMDADAYRNVLPPLGARVTILPDVDHMGVVYRPEAIKAILAAVGATNP